MMTFLFSVVALILGYLFYGKLADKVFGTDPGRAVPSETHADGLDFVPMSTPKAFLIQFLNIAGTGPIFGAIAGAAWGPSAFIWIVFGCIFGGAVHDFFSGMMSLRAGGATMGDLVGEHLGKFAQKALITFTAVLLLLVGAVFISSPADLLASLTGMNRWIFVALIIIYYFIATVLPIDKLIGKIYPIFGIALLIMAVGIVFGMVTKGYIQQIPEFDFTNHHIAGKSIFPYLCISIACGAISGFHATQSPMMARCIKGESEGRRVFYGAMICEGLIALIWAAVSMCFFGGLEGLSTAGTAAVVVNKVSEGLMGPVGMILAILGVVACPITTGDTAFRSLRLIVAEAFHLDQTKLRNCYIIVVPAFAISTALLFVNFDILWRYFAWSNQTLACVALWTIATFLRKRSESLGYLMALIPAIFMTVVIISYIVVAPEGFAGLFPATMAVSAIETTGIGIGIVAAVLFTITYFVKVKKASAVEK